MRGWRLAAGVGVTLVAAWLAWAGLAPGGPPAPPALHGGAAPAPGTGAVPPDLQPARVVRVVDGDTFVARVEGGREERVRLIGVDTPESTTRVEPFGPEAARFTRRALEGRQVYLELDVQPRDRYGRLLAYAWLEPPRRRDEAEVRRRMFNAVLLLEGYAQLLTVPPNVRYADLFVSFQREARAQGRGLWGPAREGAGGGTAAAPPPAGLRYDPSGPDRDCGDFATWREAQDFFLAAGGPARDPHRLDADRDGVACESLPGAP